MTHANLILTLAKVIIAAAWADGEVTHDEINNIKDLLFRLPNITGREWATLEMYIEVPVGADERARLVEQLKDALSTHADQTLALSALEEMIQADGTVTQKERAVAEEIKTVIQSVDVSIFGQLSRLLQSPLQRRADALVDAPNREEHFEDFIHNKVYFKVRQRLAMDEVELDIPEENLRKLCLAGGLMARVAHVDLDVKEAEFEVMVKSLQSGWNIRRQAAVYIAEVAESEIAANLDYYRLTRQFFTSTTEEERLNFLAILFEVAAADGFVSYEEIEEIRVIASSLKLTHRQFIEAKLALPRELRAN